jgi:hypothetical protein
VAASDAPLAFMPEVLRAIFRASDWQIRQRGYPECLFNSLETILSDLNNMNPAIPEDVKAKLAIAEEESRKLDCPERTNDSTIDPKRSEEDLLKGNGA